MSTNLTYENIYSSLTEFPEFLRASDLVNLGLFACRVDVTVAKKKKDALPPYINLSPHKVVFPKESLVRWLIEKHAQNNNLHNKKDG